MLHQTTMRAPKARVSWNPGPEARRILVRIMGEAEKSGAVSKVAQPNGKPAYFVFNDKLVKPLEMWRAYRLVADNKTDAPESTARRAKEAWSDPKALSSADCIYILKEWSNGSR